MPSLATFNANNFFIRYKFDRTYRGDASRRSAIEASEVAARGYVPGLAFGQYASSQYIVWDQARRLLAAQALKEPDGQLPDIVCFQEVENIQAIRILNQRYLDNHYPYSLLIDAYDPRNIDVGVLSRFPIREIRSHIDDLDNRQQRIFSRDCLEATIELPDGDSLTLFVNHLKSKFVQRQSGETEAHYQNRLNNSHKKRQAQAQKVAEYVQQRFQSRHQEALYAVVGDFNDTPESPWLQPLLTSPLLTDLLGAHLPRDARWTYYWRDKNQVSQIDYVLVSAALAQRVATVVVNDASKRPHIERHGVGYRALNASGQVLPRQATFVRFEADAVTPMPEAVTPSSKVNFRFARYANVQSDWKNNISDHCPVKIWF